MINNKYHKDIISTKRLFIIMKLIEKMVSPLYCPFIYIINYFDLNVFKTCPIRSSELEIKYTNLTFILLSQ